MGKPTIIIGYDTLSYNEEKVQKIENIVREDFDLKIRKIKQKSVDEYPLIIIALVGPPIVYFSKGFFTKIGEKLGEFIGNGIIARYKKFKEGIVELLYDKKSSKLPLLEIILKEERKPEVNIYFRTSKQKVIIERLDDIKEIYDEVIKFLSKKSRVKIKKVCITLDETGEEIKEFYYIDENDEVYSKI